MAWSQRQSCTVRLPPQGEREGLEQALDAVVEVAAVAGAQVDRGPGGAGVMRPLEPWLAAAALWACALSPPAAGETDPDSTPWS